MMDFEIRAPEKEPSEVSALVDYWFARLDRKTVDGFVKTERERSDGWISLPELHLFGTGSKYQRDKEVASDLERNFVSIRNYSNDEWGSESQLSKADLTIYFRLQRYPVVLKELYPELSESDSACVAKLITLLMKSLPGYAVKDDRRIYVEEVSNYIKQIENLPARGVILKTLASELCTDEMRVFGDEAGLTFSWKGRILDTEVAQGYRHRLWLSFMTDGTVNTGPRLDRLSFVPAESKVQWICQSARKTMGKKLR